MRSLINAAIIVLSCILSACSTDSEKSSEMCHASIVIKLVEPGTGRSITDARITAINSTLGDSGELPLSAHDDSLYRIYGKPGEYDLRISHSSFGDFVLAGIPVSDTLVDGQQIRQTINLEVQLEKDSGQTRILSRVSSPKC